MPKTDTSLADVSAWLRSEYPDVDWQLIDDLARAANAELWYGPLGVDYWLEVDPIDTPWPGFERACKQLRDAIGDLPTPVYYDLDAGCVIGLKDPQDEPENWGHLSDFDENLLASNDREVYCGPECYTEVHTLEALIPKELRTYVGR